MSLCQTKRKRKEKTQHNKKPPDLLTILLFCICTKTNNIRSKDLDINNKTKMVLIKRGMGNLNPGKPFPVNINGIRPENVLGKVAHDSSADVLAELQLLFNYAHQIFTDLTQQASQTCQRIGLFPSFVMA